MALGEAQGDQIVAEAWVGSHNTCFEGAAGLQGGWGCGDALVGRLLIDIVMVVL